LFAVNGGRGTGRTGRSSGLNLCLDWSDCDGQESTNQEVLQSFHR